MSFLDSMTPQMAADLARPVHEENQLLRARLARLTSEHFEAPPGMVGHHCGYCMEDWPCETIRIAGGDPDEPRKYAFTRDQFADALEGITVTTKMVNGSIKIGAESMADAIIEALDERRES